MAVVPFLRVDFFEKIEHPATLFAYCATVAEVASVESGDSFVVVHDFVRSEVLGFSDFESLRSGGNVPEIDEILGSSSVMSLQFPRETRVYKILEEFDEFFVGEIPVFVGYDFVDVVHDFLLFVLRF